MHATPVFHLSCNGLPLAQHMVLFIASLVRFMQGYLCRVGRQCCSSFVGLSDLNRGQPTHDLPCLTLQVHFLEVVDKYPRWKWSIWVQVMVDLPLVGSPDLITLPPLSFIFLRSVDQWSIKCVVSDFIDCGAICFCQMVPWIHVLSTWHHSILWHEQTAYDPMCRLTSQCAPLHVVKWWAKMGSWSVGQPRYRPPKVAHLSPICSSIHIFVNAKDYI